MNDYELNGHIIGWLLSTKDGVPDVPAMLEDTGEALELSVPFNSDLVEDYYARWFELTGAKVYVNNEEIHAEPVPKVLCLRQNNKSYILVGCRPNGYRRSSEWGTGIIWSTYIVNGARSVLYGNISGVRSYVPGFNEWSGLHSAKSSSQLDSNHLLEEMDIQLRSPNPIQLVDGEIKVSISPSWKEDKTSQEGTRLYADITYLQSESEGYIDWESHLQFHNRVKELLSICGWRDLTYADLQVTRNDDCLTTESGRIIIPRQWHLVSSYYPRIDRQQKYELQHFLFIRNDLSQNWAAKWFSLFDNYKEAISPMTTVVHSPKMDLATKALLCGVALEALGHQLSCEKHGFSGKQWTQYPVALKELIDDIKTLTGGIFPLKDCKQWKEKADNVYRGLKHADAESPELLDVYQTTLCSIFVFRVWIGLRLGCDLKTMLNRASLDSVAQKIYNLVTPIESVPDKEHKELDDENLD